MGHVEAAVAEDAPGSICRAAGCPRLRAPCRLLLCQRGWWRWGERPQLLHNILKVMNRVWGQCRGGSYAACVLLHAGWGICGWGGNGCIGMQHIFWDGLHGSREWLVCDLKRVHGQVPCSCALGRLQLVLHRCLCRAVARAACTSMNESMPSDRCILSDLDAHKMRGLGVNGQRLRQQ